MKHTVSVFVTGLLLTAQTTFAQPATPDICMVTVDDFSTHNIIYWDKTNYAPGDYFVIYRQNPALIFVPIDTIPYDSLSEYHDYGHTPNLAKTRYKMQVYNSSGASGISLYHTTLYCDEPTYGDFIWNDYEIEGTASPATHFVMARQDSTGNPWVPMDTVLSSVTSMTDPNAGSHPDGTWRIRTIWGITCDPTRAGVSTSRSNIRTHASGVIVVTGVQEATAINENIFNVYPNPSADMVTVQMYDKTPLTTVRVYNAYGQLLQNVNVNNYRYQPDVQSWDSGMYYIEVLSDTDKQTKSFIKL